MTELSPWGPEVPAGETLLRAITRPEWWDPEERHLSSAAFSRPKFSASILSKLDDENEMLERFQQGTGLARFNCGEARELGFDARHEPEEDHDDHANVYSTDLNGSQRKKLARKLVEAAKIARDPNNELLRRVLGNGE